MKIFQFCITLMIFNIITNNTLYAQNYQDSIDIEVDTLLKIEAKIGNLDASIDGKKSKIIDLRKKEESLKSQMKILKLEMDELKNLKSKKNSSKVNHQKRLKKFKKQLEEFNKQKSENEEKKKEKTEVKIIQDTVNYLNSNILDNGVRYKSKIDVDVNGSVKLKTEKGLFHFDLCAIDGLSYSKYKDTPFYDLKIKCTSDNECCIIRDGKAIKKIKNKHRIIFISEKGAEEFIQKMNSICDLICKNKSKSKK